MITAATITINRGAARTMREEGGNDDSTDSDDDDGEQVLSLFSRAQMMCVCMRDSKNVANLLVILS